MLKKIIYTTTLAGLLFTSCTKDENSPGYEYMPDMYRSASVEGYVDYMNPDSMAVKTPPKGTIPFTYNENLVAFNLPYPLSASPEDYEKSATVIKMPAFYNDINNVKAAIKSGEQLYIKFCVHCHGEKGDGNGELMKNGKISGVPSYSSRAAAGDGKWYHSITLGKGIMGAHGPQVNAQERWEIIHYIKYLMDNNYPAVADTLAMKADTTKNK